jgi:hypothetical protein
MGLIIPFRSRRRAGIRELSLGAGLLSLPGFEIEVLHLDDSSRGD